MPEIISLEQNCSVPQRTIFNNLFLTRDLIKYTTEKNNKFYLLQIDQEKAFDKIDRPFLFQTMGKLGLPKTFINFIEILYRQNTSMIINNGFLSENIPMSRGLRQGCPLSLPLYVIQSEIITQNINKDPNILGITIPNQKEQLKISQYADDSNFLLKNEKSVKNVITFFQKLQKATGSTINCEKTTVLPINTTECTNLPKEIKIKQRYQSIKILGIQYNENLQEAHRQNWINIIQKITNQTNKLSQRILSLKGKVQIANTIISKTSFLSNVFPIDLQTTLTIQEKIFKYIWKNKQEQIARKTIFLPKNLGGLNLLEPQAHNMAMRIKHMLQLKQSNNMPTWKNIAAYWLALDLYKISKNYHFLMSNNRVKTNTKHRKNKYHQELNDIENYKTEGTIITRKKLS